jgi:flagellar protein FlaG
MITNLSHILLTPVSSARDPVPPPSSGATVPAVAGQGQGSVVSGEAGNTQMSTSSGVQGGGSSSDLEAAVEHLNAKIQNLNRNLEFSIDQDNGEVLVRVVDAETHELVRQIPSEEVMALAHNIDQYLQEHHMGLVQTKA